jgi:hypothetical protein
VAADGEPGPWLTAPDSARRPIREYNGEKSSASLARASFTIVRIVRSG